MTSLVSHASPRLVVAVLAVALSAATARAQTTLFQTGFEATQGFSTTVARPITIYTATGTPVLFTPTPGTLYDQVAPNDVYGFFSPNTSSATLQSAVNGVRVVSNSAASGTQSVLFDGTVLGAQDVRYSEGKSYSVGTNGVFNVGVDMRVSNPSASYGQWGINLLSQNTGGGFTSVALGFVAGSMLASPDGGASLYAALNPNTGAPIAASYGVYNNYAIQMNYAARVFGATFNGAPVGFVPVDAGGNPIGNPVAAIPFSPAALNRIDYVSFGQVLPRGTSESANFDNLRVSGTNVTVVPEAGTLALVFPALGLIGAVVAARRRE